MPQAKSLDASTADSQSQPTVHSRQFLVHFFLSTLCSIAFSALTPVVRHQEEHPACKDLSDEVLVWFSVCSEVQIVCI